MNRSRIVLLWVAVLGGWLLFTHDAHAATTCTVTGVSTLQFANVDPTGNTDTQTTLNFRCDTNVVVSFANAKVIMCVGLDGGMASGSTIANRLMRDGFSDALPFQTYKEAARSNIWGNAAGSPSYLQLATINYPLTSFLGVGAKGSYTGSVTIYGRIPPLTGASAADDYANTLAGTLLFRYRDQLLQTDTTSCVAGGVAGTPANFTLQVAATVPGLCAISAATDLGFGSNPGAITSNRDSTSAIGMSCRNRSAWKIGLDNGQNALGNIRRMRRNGGSSYVTYELYSNSGRTTRWGNTVGADTVAGTSAGTGQTVTVYGQVPAPQAQPPGSYADVITVTVTY